MCKDEADVIEGTIRHLLEEDLNGILVADNGSTDGTRDILADLAREYPNVLNVVDDEELGYYQSKKMTGLAASVASEGDFVVPFDADEVWYDRADRLAVTLRGMPDIVRVIQAPLWNHFSSNLDVEGESPFERIVYRQREPGALPKVCFRWTDAAVIHQGNHGVSLPGMRDGRVRTVELRHFPYRTFEQFKRKAINGKRAYEATDLPPDTGAHWREYGAILERGGDDALREVFDRWFHFPAPVTAGLVLDPAPFRRWR